MHQVGKCQLKFVAIMLAGLGVAGLALVGCKTTFTTPTLVPAQGENVSRLNPLAVVNFTGKDGNIFSHDVEAMLVNTTVQGQPYFTVVDRQALDSVLQEIKLGKSGVVDETTAVRIGKLVGAKGIVFGAIGNNGVSDTRYTEERTECRDKNRKLFSLKSCKNERRYTVRCTKRNAHFSFTPKIVDVATGRVVISDSVTGSESDESCQDRGPVDDKAAMLSNAKQAALDQFRKLVAPYTVEVSLVVLTKDGTERPERAANLLKQGATWAKSGRLDRACKLWRESYQIHPYGYAVHYNLGLCEEYHTHNLKVALDYYRKADDLAPKPIETISTALSRVQKSIESKTKLDTQLNRTSSPQTQSNRHHLPPATSTQNVKFVQTKLNELGYDIGTPDGFFGPRTASAIQAYQQDQGLPATGTITQSLLDMLKK